MVPTHRHAQWDMEGGRLGFLTEWLVAFRWCLRPCMPVPKATLGTVHWARAYRRARAGSCPARTRVEGILIRLGLAQGIPVGTFPRRAYQRRFAM